MKIEARWTWSNWTFGVWWDRKKLRAFGLDLGPFEVMVRSAVRRGGGRGAQSR